MDIHNVIVRIPYDDRRRNPCWGYEVFIQNLPPTITDADLIDMGSCIGPVVEVRHFKKDRKAHLKFTKIEDGIKFMEMVHHHDLKTGKGGQTFKPLMSTGCDYPCLKVTGLPQGTTREVIIACIRRQAPKIAVVDVRYLNGPMAVVEFANQRIAKAMLQTSSKNPLKIGGRNITFNWEGFPGIRISNLEGFNDKAQIVSAFDLLGGGHLLGVALLKDRAFVYFDYRFNCVLAFQSVRRPFTLRMENGEVKECVISLL